MTEYDIVMVDYNKLKNAVKDYIFKVKSTSILIIPDESLDRTLSYSLKVLKDNSIEVVFNDFNKMFVLSAGDTAQAIGYYLGRKINLHKDMIRHTDTNDIIVFYREE